MKYHIIAKDHIYIFNENNILLYKLIKERKNLFYGIYSLFDSKQKLVFKYKYPTNFCFMSIIILFQDIEKNIVIEQKMCKLSLLYDTNKLKYKSSYSLSFKGKVLFNDEESAFYKLKYNKTVPNFYMDIHAKYCNNSLPILILFLLKITNFERGIMYSSDF